MYTQLNLIRWRLVAGEHGILHREAAEAAAEAIAQSLDSSRESTSRIGTGVVRCLNLYIACNSIKEQ